MNSRYVTKGGAYGILLGSLLSLFGGTAYAQQPVNRRIGNIHGDTTIAASRRDDYKTPVQRALENDMVPVIAAAKSIGNAGKQGLKDVANGGLGLAEKAIENAPGVTENIVAAIQDGWANDGKPIYDRTKNAGYSGVGAAVKSLESVERGLLVPVVNEAGKIGGDAIDATGTLIFKKATEYGPGVGGWAWDRVKVPATYAWKNKEVALLPAKHAADFAYRNTIGQLRNALHFGLGRAVPRHLFPSLHGGRAQQGQQQQGQQQQRSRRWSLF